MMEDGDVVVRYANVEGFHNIVVSDEERRRAGRFRDTEDARRFIVGRSLLRLVLSRCLGVDPIDIEYRAGPNGKPAPLDGDIRFSLTRSEDIVAVAVSRALEVGLDVEKAIPGFEHEDIVRRFFSQGEAAYLNTLTGNEKDMAFFRLWTRKEALLKATGEGIGNLSPGTGVLDKGIIVRNDRTWRLYDLFIVPGYAASLAAEGELHRVSVSRYDFS